jgi:hypothetical protein
VSERSNWKIGREVALAGYFTVLRAFGNLTGPQLGSVAGFAEGRFDEGWALLALREPPTPLSFELRGTATFPDGTIDGRSYEDQVRQHHGDIVMEQRMTWYHRFVRGGEWTPVKVVPALPRFSDDLEREFPRGAGIPQFKLTRKHEFVVVRLFGRNDRCPRVF